MNRNARNFYRSDSTHDPRQQQRNQQQQQSQQPPQVQAHSYMPQVDPRAWSQQNQASYQKQFTQVNDTRQAIPQDPKQYFNRMGNNDVQTNEKNLSYQQFEVMQTKDNWNVQRDAAIKDVKMNNYELGAKVQQQEMDLAYVNAYKPQKQQIVTTKDQKIGKEQMEVNIKNEQIMTHMIDRSIPLPTPASVAAMARRLKDQKVAPTEMNNEVNKLMRERQYVAPAPRKPVVIEPSTTTTPVIQQQQQQPTTASVSHILSPFTNTDVRRYVIRLTLGMNGAITSSIDRQLSEIEYITLLYQHYPDDYQMYVQLLESLQNQQQSQPQPQQPQPQPFYPQPTPTPTPPIQQQQQQQQQYQQLLPPPSPPQQQYQQPLPPPSPSQYQPQYQPQQQFYAPQPVPIVAPSPQQPIIEQPQPEPNPFPAAKLGFSAHTPTNQPSAYRPRFGFAT